jgi:hypothetical protein
VGLASLSTGGAAEALGAEYISHEQLAEMIRREHPNARWLTVNLIREREGVFRGSVPAGAVEGPGRIALGYGARGLQIGGMP